MGRDDRGDAVRSDGLAGAQAFGGREGSGGTGELALHRSGAAGSAHIAEVGRTVRGADFGIHFWREARASGAARL